MNKTILILVCLIFSGCATSSTFLKPLASVNEDTQLCDSVRKSIEVLAWQAEFKKQKVECGLNKKIPKKLNNKLFEIASNKPLKLTSIYPDSVIKNRALETCKEAVVSTLYYPTSFQQETVKTTIKIIDKKEATLKIPFKARTGFGSKVSQIAYCVTDSSGKILMLNIVNSTED